jgi:predicted ester cyclase
MENKEIIRSLYANVFNGGKTELLEQIVSPDYENSKGMKGIEAFRKTVTELSTAFPDAQWTLTAMVAEGNQVFIRHKLIATHKGVFQDIAPTNKPFTSLGMVLYEFKDGKIIHSDVLTDRLGFLQQLEVIPQPQ